MVDCIAVATALFDRSKGLRPFLKLLLLLLTLLRSAETVVPSALSGGVDRALCSGVRLCHVRVPTESETDNAFKQDELPLVRSFRLFTVHLYADVSDWMHSS